MKKVICSLLIVTILMNFIVSGVSFAVDDPGGQVPGSDAMKSNGLLDSDSSTKPSDTAATDVLEKGEVSQDKDNPNGAKVETNNSMGGMSIIGGVLGFLGLILDIIPLTLHFIVSNFTETTVIKADGDEDTQFWISVERIVFNKIPLFNINFFDIGKTTYTVGTGEYEVTLDISSENEEIQVNISKFYQICKTLSLIISLLVLIYIGIRMSLSAVASEQAKYKKMFVSWVESVALLFILQYIMVIIVNFGEILTDVFYNIKCALESGGDKTFEQKITDTLTSEIFQVSGLQLAMYSIMYWVLVYTHFKFAFLYMKRMFVVAFLMMISPLITVTYPIDKAGDGKDKVFNACLSEFLINIFIQPLHAIIYIVFMFTAGEIAEYAPVLGLVFLLSLGTVEKLVLRLLKKGKAVSIGGVSGMQLVK